MGFESPPIHCRRPLRQSSPAGVFPQVFTPAVVLGRRQVSFAQSANMWFTVGVLVCCAFLLLVIGGLWVGLLWGASRQMHDLDDDCGGLWTDDTADWRVCDGQPL